MGLSRAVVLSIFPLLLLPVAYSGYLKAQLYFDSATGSKEIECIDDRLFLSTVAFLRIDQEGKIKDRSIDNFHPGAARKENTVYRPGKNEYYGTAYIAFARPPSENWKAAENLTDIIVYMSSHNAESYGPVNFGYQESNLQLKKSGTVLNDVYKYGAKYIAAITLIDWHEVPKDQRVFFRSQPGTFSDVTYSKFYKDYNWPKPDYPGHFWISSPGIYRYNLVTQQVNQLYYDPSLPNVQYLT